MSKKELKPCPFCGSDDIVLLGNNTIKCETCFTWGIPVDLWNTRENGNLKLPIGYDFTPIKPMGIIKLRLKPDDILVISCEQRLSVKQKADISEELKVTLAASGYNNNILIADCGLTISALRKDGE